MARFTVLLYPEPEEGGYSVLIPVLGIATQGDTIDEALAMAREATELRVEAMVRDGEPVVEEEVPPIVAGIDVEIPVAAPA
jgi:predicted RNase H-like HicB family nuclease